MKQAISLLLVLVMALSMAACAQSNAPGSDKEASNIAQGNVSSGITEVTAGEKTAADQEVRWNLTAIYADNAAFEAEYTQAEAQIEVLAALRGKLNTVEGVVSFYKTLDNVNRCIFRLTAYTDLMVYQDLSSSEAKARSGRVSTLIQNYFIGIAFSDSELFANPPAFLDEVAKATDMKPYLIQYNRSRAQSAHVLPEEQEKLLQPIDQLKSGAYSLYQSLSESDMVFDPIIFPDGVERLANESNGDLAFTKQNPQEFRLAYYIKRADVFSQYRNTFAQNLQNHYTAVSKLASGRKYSSALEADLSTADVPLAVYDGVLAAADQAKPVLDRYFAMMEKELNVDKLYPFEASMAIADDPGMTYTFEDSKKLVKEGLSVLGSEYATKLGTMFNGNTIDSYPRENKATGAFAYSVPGSYPFLLLNHTDTFYGTSTFAHELGHGVHMLYAKDQESVFAQNPSAITTEVASTLNELLLSDYFIQNAKTEKERKYYAAEQMSMLYNTFFSQALYARFQQAAVEEVENGGTLTADKLDELWINATKDSLGEGLFLPENYAGGWARVPHFYMGFYVYQYSVGIAAACNIANRIQSGDPKAVEDYLNYLKAGDSGNAVEMLELAGVDIASADYISAFTARFDRLVKEFEGTK